MFADIAILPAVSDMWSIYGAQNEPFPIVMYPTWQTLVWESIHHNGNACDYISEKIIADATVDNGRLAYGPRKYHTIFLTQIDSLEPGIAKKLFQFAQSGGRIFFVERYPSKSPGFDHHEERDKQIQEWITKMKSLQGKCILVDPPGKDHVLWFKSIQEKYKVTPYLKIDKPVKFVSQVRYQARDTEVLVVSNANINDGYELNIFLAAEIADGKTAWAWDPETGKRSRLYMDEEGYSIYLQPSDLKLLVFDKNNSGPPPGPPLRGPHDPVHVDSWSVKGTHINGNIITTQLSELKDLKDVPGWENFCGEIVYTTDLRVVAQDEPVEINIGKAYGLSELIVNGVSIGTKWYGKRNFDLGKFVKLGDNTIEIKIVTTMVNYMKSLKDNAVAQFWTNQGRTTQPLQPIGLLGPVYILYTY